MVEGRGGERFLLEAAEPLLVLRDALGKHLDRDLAAQPRVARPIHLAHAARAEGREDFVRAQPCAGCQGHREVREILARPYRPSSPGQGRRRTLSGSDGGTSAIESIATGPPERSTTRRSAPPESA